MQGLPQSYRLEQRLAVYALSHQHPLNEALHLVAVPVIMLSLMGLLYELHPMALGFLLFISVLYYACLRHVGYFLAMIVWAAVALLLLFVMGPYRLVLCSSLFAIAWALQFVGHRAEGRKPTFVEDVQYLLVGPLFVLRTLMRKMSKNP